MDNQINVNFLRVLSTIGSQISLISMIILSIIRAKGAPSSIRPSENIMNDDRSKDFFMTDEIFLIFFIATVLATVYLMTKTNSIS